MDPATDFTVTLKLEGFSDSLRLNVSLKEKKRLRVRIKIKIEMKEQVNPLTN